MENMDARFDNIRKFAHENFVAHDDIMLRFDMLVDQLRIDAPRAGLDELQAWRTKAMTGTLKKDVWKIWNFETDLIDDMRSRLK